VGTNGRIAFVSTRDGNAEIYTANPDGTNQTRLTNTPDAQELTPAWSPDGTSLAFTRTVNREPNDTRPVIADIYVVNADGTNLRAVTNGGGFNLSPSWSPDGRRIVFSRSSFNPELFLTRKPSAYDILSASADIFVIGGDGKRRDETDAHVARF
jgi:TolB protein